MKTSALSSAASFFNKKLPSSADIIRAEDLRKRADMLCREGLCEEAISRYTESIRLNPTAEAYFNRGALFFEQKMEFDLAKHDFTRAVQLNGKFAQAYIYRGRTRCLLGDLQGALPDFTAAVDCKDESRPTALRYRGDVYGLTEKYETALFDLTEALTLEPVNSEFFLSRGNIYAAMKEFNQAILDYSMAIGLNHLYQQAYSNRAQTYLLIGENEKAFYDIGMINWMEKIRRDVAVDAGF